MINKFTTLLYIILLFIISGCDDTNSNTPIPGYMEIPGFTLEHENAIGITDVWVDVNGDFVGVFELPAKFPVIAEGPSKVILKAGIKVNGMGNTRSYYPYYKIIEKSIDFKPSEVITITPETTYGTWANVIWNEDFENGHKFEKNNNSDTVFVVTDKDKFEGYHSGAIYLDTANRAFEANTPELSRPDLGTSGMFLELNYKGDIPFEIGLYINYQNQVNIKSVLAIYSSSEWKKIYIDLYNPLLQYPKGTAYKIYIRAWHNMSKPSSTIYIDDFKIVQNSDKKKK